MASRITSAASTADEYYYNQTVTPTDAATHTGQLERDAGVSRVLCKSIQ